jgi:hypothetical protein
MSMGSGSSDPAAGPFRLPAGDSGGSGGQVDYALVRRHAVNEFHRGRLGRRDVCDAHPELMRAARNVGRDSGAECPICGEEGALVLVSFAFGRHLPASGRCVSTARELASLARRADESTCYVVEVCTACSWNHLRRRFPLGGAARRRLRS